MRRTPLIALAIALVLVVVLTAAWGSGSASRAALRVRSTSPLTVRGLHFKASERVRVAVVATGKRAVKRIRATARGTFTTSGFRSVGYDPCSSDLFVSAAGSRGSRAALKVPQRECPPRL
jgi:hypothetical protein